MNDEIMQKLKEHDREFIGIKERLGRVEVDVKFLKEDAHQKGIIFEDHTSKLNQVLEVVLHTNRMLVPRHEVDRQFENHEHRIAALEYIISKTPQK